MYKKMHQTVTNLIQMLQEAIRQENILLMYRVMSAVLLCCSTFINQYVSYLHIALIY